MNEIRRLDPLEERAETGPMQFGDDWPGIFIRGDNAIYYGFLLNTLLEDPKNIDVFGKVTLQELTYLLKSSRV